MNTIRNKIKRTTLATLPVWIITLILVALVMLIGSIQILQTRGNWTGLRIPPSLAPVVKVTENPEEMTQAWTEADYDRHLITEHGMAVACFEAFCLYILRFDKTELPARGIHALLAVDIMGVICWLLVLCGIVREIQLRRELAEQLNQHQLERSHYTRLLRMARMPLLMSILVILMVVMVIFCIWQRQISPIWLPLLLVVVYVINFILQCATKV